MRPVGRIYLERGQPVVVLIQWGAKSRGETYGGPRNVLIQRETGELVVRPFRGLRASYRMQRGNRIPEVAHQDLLDEKGRAEYDRLRSLPCGFCGRHLAPGPWWDAHDPCIADLPDVAAACCGHGYGHPDGPPGRDGQLWDACYVLFRGGPALYGNAARAAIRMLGGDPPDAPDGATVREAPGDWRGVVG